MLALAGGDGSSVLRRQRRQRPDGEQLGRTLLAALEAGATADRGVHGAPIRCRAARSSSSRRLVAEVRYTEVTERGMLRQPVLLGVRDDKAVRRAPTTCRARRGGREPRRPPSRAPPPAAPAPSALHRRRASREQRGKVFWPDDGYTKGDLLAYYDAIWPCDRALPARSAAWC